MSKSKRKASAFTKTSKMCLSMRESRKKSKNEKEEDGRAANQQRFLAHFYSRFSPNDVVE